MKKKLLLVTLCTGIVLSSVACGSTKSTTSSKSTSSVSNTQASTSKVKKEVKKTEDHVAGYSHTEKRLLKK